jgi:hypothetical protein
MKIKRETLEMMQKILGKEHPHTLTSMNNLACALWEKSCHHTSGRGAG